MPEMRQGQSQEPDTSAFPHIQRRIRAASPSTVKAVGVLREKGNLKWTFHILAGDLHGKRQRYLTLEDFKKSNEDAKRLAGPTDPGEAPQWRRPDRGRPSLLELYFLELLDESQWKDLCDKYPENDKTAEQSGALSVRSVIEHVLSDQPRTKAFIGAVQERVRSFNAGPKTIYDVGCGAVPLLAIAAALAAPKDTKVNIVGIEINPLSAEIADLIVRKLRLEDKIRIICADATDPTTALPEEGSINLLIVEMVGPGLLTEKLTEAMPRYARCLNRENGFAIPSRALVSAALVPNGYRKQMEENAQIILKKENARRRGEHYEGPEPPYSLMLNINGFEFLAQPEGQWHFLADLDPTKPVECIRGTLSIPEGVPLQELNKNFSVGISVELILGPKDRRKLPRNESAPTSPANLGMIVIPENSLADLMNEEPNNLEVYFEFTPGENSQKRHHIEVRRKK